MRSQSQTKGNEVKNKQHDPKLKGKSIPKEVLQSANKVKRKITNFLEEAKTKLKIKFQKIGHILIQQKKPKTIIGAGAIQFNLGFKSS